MTARCSQASLNPLVKLLARVDTISMCQLINFLPNKVGLMSLVRFYVKSVHVYEYVKKIFIVHSLHRLNLITEFLFSSFIQLAFVCVSNKNNTVHSVTQSTQYAFQNKQQHNNSPVLNNQTLMMLSLKSQHNNSPMLNTQTHW